jgi:hypothetical protein
MLVAATCTRPGHHLNADRCAARTRAEGLEMVKRAAIPRRAALTLCGLVLMVIAVSTPLRRSVNVVDQPCPEGAHVARPVVIWLNPSLVRHQSWVGIPASLVALDMELVACVDGRIAGRSIVDENDIQRTVATVNVATNWVMMAWVTGRIDEYRDPEHWQVIVSPQCQDADS